jgi:hypothetical protein
MNIQHARACMSCTEIDIWSHAFNTKYTCYFCRNDEEVNVVKKQLQICDEAAQHYYVIRSNVGIAQNPHAKPIAPMNDELYADPMRCYALYFLEHYADDDLGRTTIEERKDQIRLVENFFSSFSETTINYVHYMSEVPNRLLKRTGQGGGNEIIAVVDAFSPLLKYLGQLTYSTPTETLQDAAANGSSFSPLFLHEIRGQKFITCASYVNSWIGTASELVETFLFKSCPGFNFTDKNPIFFDNAGSPAYRKLRRSHRFIDWLNTHRGFKWLCDKDKGFEWLISNPTYIFPSNPIVEERVIHVGFIKKAIQSCARIRQLYDTEDIGCPYEYEDCPHFSQG